MTHRLHILISLLVFLALPMPAMAYVGPGSGMGAIATVIALIGAVLLGIVGFIWYPIKRLIRGGTKDSVEDTSEVTAQVTENKQVEQND